MSNKGLLAVADAVLSGVASIPAVAAQFPAGIHALAEVYRADHAADDDEPLTQEWVNATFQIIPGRGAIISHVLSLFNTRHGWIIRAGRDGADDSDDSFCILIVETRGDVRRLCKAVAAPVGQEEGR